MIKRCRLFMQIIILLFVATTTLKAAQINFVPELYISEEYTDNLFLDFDDEAKVDDYITTAGLSLTTEIISRTSGLELNYSPSYSSFADTEDLDFSRHYGRLRLWHAFKRNTRLELSGIYLETEDPRDESDQEFEQADVDIPAISADPTRRGRTRYRNSVNTLRLSHQYGAKNSVYGAFEYSIFEDIDPPSGTERDDNQAWQPSAGIEHWFNPQWGFAADALYSSRAYEDRDDRTESYGALRVMRSFNRRLSGFIEYEHTVLDFDQETEDEDYQLYAPSVGIEYLIGESTELTLGAGYYIQNFDQTDDEEGFYVNSNIVHKATFRTGFVTLTAGSGYDVEDTGAQDLGLQLYYLAGIDAGINFTSKFSGNAYASYRIEDYLNETPERTDQTFNTGTGISYQALRWMQFQLTYDYQNVTSDIEAEEYIENSVILKLTMSPSRPYRLN